ncbi:T9SS type A sorting domain-containing protein [Neolewinella persica]|uniref:T9SS type A sorting domain-containing protein n=1 Tax=Neolewinella persica TaxID=70998 RepID=UPI00037A3998|nr:T9SS type A sorting domain-containing protein [Neolewinella persica]
MHKNLYINAFRLLFCTLLLSTTIFAQDPGNSDRRPCQQDAIVSLAFSGATELNTCTDDDIMDRIRFQVNTFNQAYAYVVVDEGDVIRSIGFSNFINFDMLPAGTLRVFAFSNYGRITASVGEDFNTATLSVPCAGLTSNFVTVNNGTSGDVVIEAEQDQYDICLDDEPDVLTFTSTASNVYFIFVNSDGLINAISDTGVNDINNATPGICRVYAFASPNGVPAGPGEPLSLLEEITGCGIGLSQNFITLNRVEANGGTILTADGESSVLTCPGDGNDDFIDFAVTGTSGGNNRIIITDDQNIIIGLPEGTTVNFEDAPVGVCRAWNLAFTGDFIAEEGQNVLEAQLASICQDLSDTFVEVRREVPVGGTVLTVDGQSEVQTCPGDGEADIVEVVSTGASGGSLIYLITDGDGNLLGSNTEPNFDVEGAGVGACRIYALAYQGNLTLTDGVNVPTATDLADNCFDLSSTFVTAIRLAPEGGTVATVDGETELTVCPGDGIADDVSFASDGADPTANFTYVVTDANNNVLGVPAGNTVNFDGAGFGACRLWGLSYVGSLSIEVGDDLLNVELSDGCFDLSDNFVTVNREAPEGGSILTATGESSLLICPGDGNEDIVEFVVTGATGPENRLVITDENNIIIGLPDGNSVDFDGAEVGICRAWNVSFYGSFTAEIGQDATVGPLAEGCNELSEDFVEVRREIPAGGTVLTTDGDSEVETCPGDGNADVIEVVTSDASGGELVYLITDADNILLDFSDTPSFDVEGAGVGACRIYSLTYQGNLTLTPGVDVTTTDLADNCFALSTTFVNVVRSIPNGGTVATEDGETELTVCPGDGVDDEVFFASTGADPDANFIFVITDANNLILGILAENSINFEEAPLGACRVWGVSYVGMLLIEVGDVITEAMLAEGCSSLSDNFVTVTRELPTGGTVRLENGATEATVCPGDGVNDILTFVSEGSIGENFTFVITTNDGSILGFPASASINFEEVPPGTCRLYGLTYSGDLIGNVDDNINTTDLATACYALSDNFVTVIRQDATTGPISTADGETEILACPGDAFPDVFRFDSTGTTLTNFNYLVTDANNVVVFVAFTDRIDFEQLPVGVCRVYGLGYDGIVSARPGDIAGEDPLATQCYALSENFVTVTKELPDGGTIATIDGLNAVSVCSMDGVADIIEVVSTDAVGAGFTFLLTTDENIILGVFTDAQFDFDEAPFGVCRIWGLSYQGDLTAFGGDNATTAMLSTSCFDLSDNFVTVTREDILGGEVSLGSGATEVSTCPSDGIADLLSFTNIGATGSNYQYVVTNEENEVLSLVDGSSFDFDPAGPGVCRVWGFAYAGDVVIMVGDTVTTDDLASGCAALSDNYITVTREIPDGGSVSLADGTNIVDVCSGVEEEPALQFITTSASGSYTYLIAQDSIALTAIPSDSFNFNMAQSGVYQVFGLAFAGNLSILPGQNIFLTDLSTSCFELSDTFINVVVTEVDGATILGNGEEELYFCPENLEDGFVRFTNTSGTASDNYTYVVTTATAQPIILQVVSGDSTEALPLMELRVYGICWSGEFVAGPGTPLNSGLLATGCVDISDNYVTIFNDTPEAGEISFDNVPATGVFCTVNGDGNISVSTTSDSQTGYAVIVTDTFNVVQLVSTDQSNVDLGSLPEGPYRVWGLAYTGNVVAQVGDDIAVAVLADNCYELTSSFLDVTYAGSINAGFLTNLTTEGTGDTIRWCIADGDNPIAVVDASVSGPNYRYLVTDPNGRVRATNLPSPIIPFQPFGPGEYRIYGFNYTGMSLVGINQNINTTLLATGCAALSTNFITVIYVDPDGGMVTTTADETEVEVEITGTGTDATAIVSFMTTSDSLDNFVYVVTNEDNMLLAISESATIDFGLSGVGVCRVWGLAYTGEIIAGLNDDALATELTDGCFALSGNFVTVTRVDEVGFDNPGNDEENALISSLIMTARPNPASGNVVYLDIESLGGMPDGTVYVRDINGVAYSVQPLVSGGSNSTTLSLDIGMLPAGMYFAQVATEEGLQSVRFMKR